MAVKTLQRAADGLRCINDDRLAAGTSRETGDRINQRNAEIGKRSGAWVPQPNDAA